jgi:electron transfer flavoprotein beta subunit
LQQVTYAESVKVENGIATIKRRIENGFETVTCPLPLVVTVNGSADACRPRNAKLIQKYKYAVTPSEKAQLSEDRQKLVESRPYLNIREWGVADIEADPNQIGMKGSPTKVKTVVNVVFQAKESKTIEGGDEAQLEGLVQELIADHIIG